MVASAMYGEASAAGGLKMRTVLMLAIWATTCGAAYAQEAPACSESRRAIDEALKEYAYADAQALIETSELRHGLYATQQAAQMATVQTNLTLMAAAHCRMPDHAPSAHLYSS